LLFEFHRDEREGAGGDGVGKGERVKAVLIIA